jgi:hypothetical protein
MGLAGRVLRPAGLAHRQGPAGSQSSRAGGCRDSSFAATVGRGRWRCPLLRGDGGVAPFSGGDRHSGRRNAGGHGLAGLGSPPDGGRHWSGGHHRCQHACRAVRPRAWHWYPLERLHHRIHERLRNPGCPVCQHQPDRSRRAQALGLSVVADAREALQALTTQLTEWRAEPACTHRAGELAVAWDGAGTAAYDLGGDLDAALLTSQVIGAVNDLSGARDAVVCAAGSMTGDLHMMWRTNDAKGYQVEYGYSCMVTRSPRGSGSRWHLPTVRSSSMVGGGSYRMMAQEPVTAMQEGIKLVVVIVWNHGFTRSESFSKPLVPHISARAIDTAVPVVVLTATSCRSTWSQMLPASAHRPFAPTPWARQAVPGRGFGGDKHHGGPRRMRARIGLSVERVMVGCPGGRGVEPVPHAPGPVGVRPHKDQPAKSPGPFRRRRSQRVAPVISHASPRARQPRARPRSVMNTTNANQRMVIACACPVTVCVPASKEVPVARTVRIKGR